MALPGSIGLWKLSSPFWVQESTVKPALIPLTNFQASENLVKTDVSQHSIYHLWTNTKVYKYSSSGRTQIIVLLALEYWWQGYKMIIIKCWKYYSQQCEESFSPSSPNSDFWRSFGLAFSRREEDNGVKGDILSYLRCLSTAGEIRFLWHEMSFSSHWSVSIIGIWEERAS